MPLSRTWFEPCADCADPEVCKDGEDCTEGWDCEHALGFDFSQAEEDKLNDQRRR